MTIAKRPQATPEELAAWRAVKDRPEVQRAVAAFLRRLDWAISQPPHIRQVAAYAEQRRRIGVPR